MLEMPCLQHRDHRSNVVAIGSTFPFEGQTARLFPKVFVAAVGLLAQEHAQAACRDLLAGATPRRLERGHHAPRDLQPGLIGVPHAIDKARDHQLDLLLGTHAGAGDNSASSPSNRAAVSLSGAALMSLSYPFSFSFFFSPPFLPSGGFDWRG